MKIILDEKTDSGEEYKTKLLIDTEGKRALAEFIEVTVAAKMKRNWGLPGDNDIEMYEIFRSLRKARTGVKFLWENAVKDVIKILVGAIVAYAFFKKD